ncbi:HNH endonuclease [Candidatus Agathobaculum pullicola]|uniref:HNH endonuclease n=1 Tax=Candidatus Agathobaculum pullicola TaxID=2838426 RepID=UPI001F474B85|nr:HNH endonuclease [Oscillibacter valericigenes]
MKNFPHQINDIPKLIAALRVYQDLLIAGADTSDDEVLGYAMASALVYKFRNQRDDSPSAIAARIESEKQKTPQNQGARTAARDIRRFFELAHFVDAHGITKMGQNILDAGGDVKDPVVQHLWRNAMRDIALPTTNTSINSVSHPYQVLLNLVKARPNLSRDRLALALEAETDSDEELQRILHIADLPDWIDQIHCSEAQRRNAVKILPAIARQIGDITNTGQIRQKNAVVAPGVDRQQNEAIEDFVCYNYEIAEEEYPDTFAYSGKPKAKRSPVSKDKQKAYPRDRAVAVNALVHANHACEVDASHGTFVRRSNNKPYTEPHHLVPLAFSDSFDVSLDIEENVISLCSTCHNRIHYGKDAAEIVKKLYDQRKDLLQQVGIEITLEELLSMY